jgi:hypothetical protein
MVALYSENHKEDLSTRCGQNARSFNVKTDTRARGAQKSSSHLKILGTRSVTQNKSHFEDLKVFGTTVQNLVARELCTPVLGYRLI